MQGGLNASFGEELCLTTSKALTTTAFQLPTCSPTFTSFSATVVTTSALPHSLFTTLLATVSTNSYSANPAFFNTNTDIMRASVFVIAAAGSVLADNAMNFNRDTAPQGYGIVTQIGDGSPR